MGTAETLGGGGGDGTGLFGVMALILGGGGGGVIDFFSCENIFFEKRTARINADKHKMNFLIKIFD